MKRTILLLCVLSVLAWAAGNVLAQGKGQGKERGGNAGPKKSGETAKADANAPAAGKKAMTPEDMEKMAKEKGKGAAERGQGQAQTRDKGDKGGKGGKDQVADKMAEAKAKGKAQEQQMRAFDKQVQHEAAKHMERQARLTRLRELAVQKGDTKKVAQVDELIAKEKQLYETKLQKMQAQNRAGGTVPPTGAPLPKEGGKGKDKGKVEGEKSAEKPAGEAAKPAETKPEAQTPPPAAGQPAPAQEKPAEAPKPATPEPNAPKPQ